MTKFFHSLYGTVSFLFLYLVLTGLLPEGQIFGQPTQLTGAQTRILTNVQSGTAYTILASDCGKLISFSNSSSVAVTLPATGPLGITAGCWMDLQNLGPGTVTLTPATTSIDQSASLQLTANQGLRLVSTGNQYLTQRGQGSSASIGTVTNTTGVLVPGALVTGNSGTDLKTPVPAATMDDIGNISIPGILTTNTACSGCGGAIDLMSGSDPGEAQPANSVSLIAPDSIGSAYRWKLPAADSSGAIVSDGGATPGTLSIIPFSGTGELARVISPQLTTPVLNQPMIANYSVATLPTGQSGTLAYVTDGSTATDCTLGLGSNKVLCAYNGAAWAFPGATVATTFNRLAAYIFDGGGTPLSGNQDACVDVPAAATITGVTLLSDQAGSATVDVRTVMSASYNGPVSAGSITASATPRLSGAARYQDTTLTGWATAVPANTVMCFHLSNPTTVTWVMVDVQAVVN